MFKKTIIVLTVLLVGLLAISAVSAETDTLGDIASTDNATNTVGNTDETILDSAPTDELEKDNENINDSIPVDTDSGKLKMSPDEVLGDEINVTGDSFQDISQAIGNAKDGDTIYLQGKTYKGNGEKITVNKELTIIGGFKQGDGEYATLDAQKLNNIFWIEKPVTLYGIKFINGYLGDKDAGGAIYVNSDCTLIDCIFNNNYAEYGGAIYVNGNCTLIDCIFINNGAEGGGATQWSENSIVGGIINCTFENNTALFAGANIFNCVVANVTLTGNFINNTALMGGANFFTGAVTNVTFTCNFINNTALSACANFFREITNVTLTGNYINNNLKQEIIDAMDDDDFINNYINQNGLCSIYIANSYSGNVICDSIFINNDPINVTNGTVAAYDNWFGNNATNYNVEPTDVGIDLDNWLFLNGTADPNPVSIADVFNIIFMLSRYDGNNVSSYDNSRLLPINLNITSTLAGFNTNQAHLNESITYAPQSIGAGSVTASFENVLCTIEIEIQKADPDMSIESYPSFAGENTTITIALPSDAGGNVTVTDADGNNYTRQVKDGVVDIEVPNLNVGLNKLNITYSGDDEKYLPKTAEYEVQVDKMPTSLLVENIEMYQGDGTKYVVNLTDMNGNPVVGMGIKVNITGKTYTIITDENGTAVLPINLKAGIHPAVAFFNGKGNYANATPVSTNVSIMTKVRIDQHKDMTKDYGDSDKFTVHAVDKYGKSVGAYAKVMMTIAGKTYTVFTDENGYASLAINLKPGTYDITCEYAGYKVTHKITVKQVLSATNRQYKKATSYQFTATLKHSNGKAISGKTVTFTFKGKTYTATTNSKGEATITIKEALNLGTYNIAIKYLDSTIKKTITIK